MIGVRRSYGGWKRNRQSDPLVEVKNFGKNQKSWQLDWTTRQRGQRRKKEVKALKPHVYFYIIFIFISRIPLIPPWFFSKKLGYWKFREGFLFWEDTSSSSKEKLSALWKALFFSFWNPHFRFIQTFSSSIILGCITIPSDQGGCPSSY